MKKIILLFLIVACVQCGKLGERENSRKEKSPSARGENADNNSIEVLGENEGLLSRNIIKILVHGDDIFCLSETGLVRINRETGKVLNHPVSEGRFFSFDLFQEKIFLLGDRGISSFSGEKTEPVFQTDQIIPELIQVSEQLLCLARDGSLYQMDREQRSFSLARRITNIPFSLIRSAEDRIFLTDQKGLYQYDVRQDRLTNFIVREEGEMADFILDRDTVYFGKNSIYRLDLPSGELKKILILPREQTAACLYRDGDYLYIGKERGITRLNLLSGRSSEILEPFFVRDARVRHMVRDGHILLVATGNYGLIKYITNPPSL